MKTLLVICALVAVATACNELQRLKVKQQWSVAFGTAGNRIDFGTAMWRGVFRQAPDMVDLFERVNGKDIKSGEFTAHSMRVLGGLNMVISILDNQDGILEICLHHLKDQHKEMAIPRNYFQIFKNSLMKVVPAAIGRCFDAEAWSSCYDTISNAMTNY